MKNFHHKFPAVVLAATFLLFSCTQNTRTSPETADSTAIRQSIQDQQQRQAEACKTAITTLLQQDSTVNHSADADYAAIATGMRQLDLSQCPRNLAVDYVTHMKA